MSLLALLVPAPAVTAIDEITVFVPAFEGPGALGTNVATILNLQVWQTFRRAPWPDNPDGLDFGRGLVIWDSQPLETPSHRTAEARAMSLDVLAQMAMWGKAYPYGDGVVVQTYLSIPRYDDFREQQLERWTVSVEDHRVTVDIPRLRHEMAPIRLTRDVIERYSLPSSLELWSEREGGRVVGEVGEAYVALQLEPRVALVRSNGVEGWVRLPSLAESRTEVPDFVGGVVRIFRGDWHGAIELMQRVIRNAGTRAALKLDAYLYLTMATAQAGKPTRDMAERALELNPYSRTAVQYLVMSDLARLGQMSRAGDGNGRAAGVVEGIRETLSRYAHLFPAQDLWVRQVIDALGARGEG